MDLMSRRNFMKSTTVAAASVAAGPFIAKGFAQNSPNDTITIASVGIRGRGQSLYQDFSKLPNVRVGTICDIDEREWPQAVKYLESNTGKAPKTEYDLRRVLDDKDIDAIVVATPDHWHSLAAIWACQSGKDVYVEKPVCHNLFEGRRLIDAARKYNRVVASGMQSRSNPVVRAAMKFLQDGKLGEVYMAKALCFKPRDSIGHKVNSPAPAGVHYDIWLGPAPYRPFNENRFHYNWHWFWDYGDTDMGNQGVHEMDKARWGLGKTEHPAKIFGTGGYYAWDSDQETPNTQMTTYQYADGKLLIFEVRGLYSNAEDGIRIGNLYYGSEGWMHLMDKGFYTYFGRKNEPGPKMEAGGTEVVDPSNLAGTGGGSHAANFISCMRSRKWQDLSAEVSEGYLSAALCHLGNISYRLGKSLVFDGYAEKFVNDEIADTYLTRDYRAPFVVPDKV